jgi:hypothetical protein
MGWDCLVTEPMSGTPEGRPGRGDWASISETERKTMNKPEATSIINSRYWVKICLSDRLFIG